MYGLAADGDFGGEYTGAGAGQSPASVTQPSRDTLNVCDPESRMFDGAVCNTLYVPKGPGAQWIPGYDNSTVVIAGAVFVGFMAFIKGRR